MEEQMKERIRQLEIRVEHQKNFIYALSNIVATLAEGGNYLAAMQLNELNCIANDFERSTQS